MNEKSVGFIGGGRITQILLGGWARAGQLPREIVVSDVDEKVLAALKQKFPGITTVTSDNRRAASQKIVFLALHPPAIGGSLAEIRTCLHEEAVLISLAPKLTFRQLSSALGNFPRIIRMIPNAPSILNAGYNPVAFSGTFSQQEKEKWLAWFRLLGECPEVPEANLEAYAIITAMGPTYLWFQLNELVKIAQSFGLDEAEAKQGVTSMSLGAAQFLSDSGMSPEQVMDLVPVKPLGEAEAGIKEIYQQKLSSLYQKLKA